MRIARRGLGRIDEVVFLGARGRGRRRRPSRRATRARRTVVARVPRTARQRPASRSSRATARASPRRAGAARDRRRGAAHGRRRGVDRRRGAERQASSSTTQRPAELSYVRRAARSRPTSRVELVRAADGAVDRAAGTPGDVAPGAPQTVRWDGTAGGRVAARRAATQFRVTAIDGAARARRAGAAAPSRRPRRPARFTLPAATASRSRGAHGYGDRRRGASAAAAGTRARTSFAACGTPLVAARGGVVKFKQYQSRAGNYLVIDGDAHRRRLRLHAPARRRRSSTRATASDTGQLIGYVGDTGDADGCHLHFEDVDRARLVRAAAAPFDPLPDLRAWDAQS